ncbi:hypothetical protein [Shewanella frigidimarina]|jgi:hypothetical protein|uniref:hypothetical protein n=1 Tax=Shewanella frigidimarina TaxID=56812 RepID=UPI003D7BAD0E
MIEATVTCEVCHVKTVFKCKSIDDLKGEIAADAILMYPSGFYCTTCTYGSPEELEELYKDAY